jgi:SH3 domain-containing YSC84-like protein 1
MSNSHRLLRRREFCGSLSLAAFGALSGVALGRPALAEVARGIQAESVGDIREAVEAFRRVQNAQRIPAAILGKAVGVGVFNNLVRAAFIVGGTGGDGVITRRISGEWTVPAFYGLGGASVGAQIGGTKTDLVLVFTRQQSLDALLDNKLEIGAEVTAVAGPVAAGQSDTAHGILIYARQQGLFAGAALNGAVITPKDDQNRGTYGLTARDILEGKEPSTTTPGTEILAQELAKALGS